MYEAMNAVTKVVIEMIRYTGYVVSFTYDDNAKPVVTAVDESTRVRWPNAGGLRGRLG